MAYSSNGKPTINELILKAGVKDRLNKQCSEQAIEKIIEYCKQWKRIGSKLGLTTTQIEDIDKEKKTEDEKRSTMLSMWKQIYSYKATFEKLVKAIYDCDCTEDAYQICIHLATTEGKDDISTTHTFNNLYYQAYLTTADEKEAEPAEPPLPNRDINYVHLIERIQPNGSSRDYSERTSHVPQDRARTTKEDLETTFSSIIDEFENSVGGVPLDDLHKTAASLPYSVREDLKDARNVVRCMIRAESTVEFLGELNTHTCYLCPSPIQYMVTKYGSKKCKQMMAEYQETLLIYRQTTTIKQHINKQGETRPMHREFVEILGSDWEEKSVEDFIQHCNRQHLCDSLLQLLC